MTHVSPHRRKLNILFLTVLAAAAVGVFYALAQLGIGIPCPFYSLTGLLCPGCGNSRAALALLRLDLPAALACNPMFPVQFSYLLFVYIRCCTAYLKGGDFTYRSSFPLLDAAVLALTVLWGILRNLL